MSLRGSFVRRRYGRGVLGRLPGLMRRGVENQAFGMRLPLAVGGHRGLSALQWSSYYPFLLLSERFPFLGEEGVLRCREWVTTPHRRENKNNWIVLGSKLLPVGSSIQHSRETQGHTDRDGSQHTEARGRKEIGKESLWTDGKVPKQRGPGGHRGVRRRCLLWPSDLHRCLPIPV